jgi:hypothetical protein
MESEALKDDSDHRFYNIKRVTLRLKKKAPGMETRRSQIKPPASADV